MLLMIILDANPYEKKSNLKIKRNVIFYVNASTKYVNISDYICAGISKIINQSLDVRNQHKTNQTETATINI